VLIEDCRNVGIFTDGDATKDSNHNFLNVDVKRCDGDGVYLLRNNKWIGGQSSYNDGYGFNFGAGTGATNMVLSYAESNGLAGSGKTGSELATPPLTSAAFNAFVGANPTLQLYDPRYDARGSTGLMEIRYRGSDDYLEFNRPLFPDASGTRDLGSGLTRWGDAYVDRLDAGGAIDSASIIKSTRTSGSSVAFAAEISGESASRFTVGANGKLSWGDGTGADTELSRGAANRLDLGSDDTLRVSAGVDWQTSTLGTCASGLRGQMQWVEGASTVADELWVCRKKADDTYAWAKATFT
jgi:hypothetical protein